MSRHNSKKVPLNEYWIPADGIEREVLQASIQNWLGPDSTCSPMIKDGKNGFKIRALRQPTGEMIVDLRKDSRRFREEANAFARQGEPVPAFKDTGLYRDIQQSAHSSGHQSSYITERDYPSMNPPGGYHPSPAGRGGGSRQPVQQSQYSDYSSLGSGGSLPTSSMNASYPNPPYLPGQQYGRSTAWPPGGDYPSGYSQMNQYSDYSTYSQTGYPSAPSGQGLPPDFGVGSGPLYNPDIPSRYDSGVPRGQESRTARPYDPGSLAREYDADKYGGYGRSSGSSQGFDLKKPPMTKSAGTYDANLGREYDEDIPSGGYSRSGGGSSQGYDPKQQLPSKRR